MAPGIATFSSGAQNDKKQDNNKTCHPSLLRRPVAWQRLLVLPLILLATAAQYAPLALGLLGRYLDGESLTVSADHSPDAKNESLMVFAENSPNPKNDHSPNAKNDVSSQTMHCVNVDNMTCASHDEKYPDWIDKCNQNPNLQQCQFDCWDGEAPDAYQNTTLRESQADAARFNNSSLVSDPFSSIWPPIDQGEWKEDHEYCLAHANTTSNCLLDKYRFHLQDQDRNTFETRSRQQACDLLHKHNISDISLIGDSLIRHLGMGLIMVLEDDWNRGFHPKKKGCKGDVAFTEQGCRRLSFDMQVCRDQESGRTIHFKFQQHNPRKEKHTPPILREGGNGKTLHVYGVGNHPATGQHSNKERLGILNVEAYKSTRWITFQEKEFWGKGDYLLWLPPHFKMKIYRADSSNQRALQFMKESHEFFSKLGASTLNTYSMTKAATRFLYRGSLPPNATPDMQGYFSRETCQPMSVTWDGFPFARTINVMKAHLVLERVARLFQ